MTYLLLALGLLLLVPTLVFLLEVLFGLLAGERTQFTPVNSATAAILIPAHNEEKIIGATLKSLLNQLQPGDFILVVADNCTDGTADVARQFGASVVERHDTMNRGKGFALAHGLDVLKPMAAEVVIVVDADCSATAGSIQALKSEVLRSKRPVQGFSWMRAPKGHEKRFAVAEFAWRVKNRLRPAGLSVLGLPCQLMGTGMAFPRDLAKPENFSSGNIVEDLELGVRLARSGRAPVYYPDAVVASEFPLSEEGEISQRRRWESGSFSMLLQHGVGNVISGIVSGNKNLTALGFDMLVPPLVLHAAMILLYSAVTIVMALLFGTGALWLALLVPLLFGIGIAIAWWSEGRELLPPKFLVQLVPFILAKFRIYSGRNKGWVRTDRSGE